MKKKWSVILFLGVLAGFASVLPFQSSDVAQLVPVETLVVSMDQGEVVLNGGACQGRGATWQEAWSDLQKGAAGTVFLGTAEQVVLTGGAAELLPDAAWCEGLRPAATVCVCPGPAPEPEEAAAYLGAHNGGVTLQSVQAALLAGEAIELPVLINGEGGLRLHGTRNR